MSHPALSAMFEDRAVVVVRADHVADPIELCAALVEGGIRTVEFTFTTPDVLSLVSAASAADTGATVGVGTVLAARDATAALNSGARFVVTPGVRPEVVEAVRGTRVAAILGALTPTEVLHALDAGCDAVKVFPAQTVGPDHFAQLHGPYPQVDLIASGGVHEGNAAAFLSQGARAVTAGSSVVPAPLVAAGDWREITRRTRAFVRSLDGPGTADAPSHG